MLSKKSTFISFKQITDFEFIEQYNNPYSLRLIYILSTLKEFFCFGAVEKNAVIFILKMRSHNSNCFKHSLRVPVRVFKNREDPV